MRLLMLLALKTTRKRRKRKGERCMKKKKKTTKAPTPYLPEDLKTAILLCLPVKSVIRFKCVSKSWFSFISDPSFAESHFKLTTHTRRIEFISNDLRQTVSIDFEETLDNGFGKRCNFLHPGADFDIEIISSCRGFIFLHHSSSFRILNPCTKLHRQIPLSPGEFEIGSDLWHFYYLYGFGYDQFRDDYLVVTLSYEPGLEEFSRLEFFSLKDNRWNEIKDTQFPYTADKGETRVGSLFNEAIHWLALRSDSWIAVIIAFDLIERRIFEMPFPNCVSHKSGECLLWVFGEFLSLWAIDWKKMRIEIWVMKEYKVDSSWTIALVLPMHNMSIYDFAPICSTKNGDIIITDREALLLRYDDKGQLLEHSSYRCNAESENSRGSQAILYTESLLSLPGDHMQPYVDHSN